MSSLLLLAMMTRNLWLRWVQCWLEYNVLHVCLLRACGVFIETSSVLTAMCLQVTVRLLPQKYSGNAKGSECDKDMTGIDHVFGEHASHADLSECAL